MISIFGLILGALLPAGAYHTAAGTTIFVGPERYASDPVYNQYFDPRTQRYGELEHDDAKAVTLATGIQEERRTLTTANGNLGVSLYSLGEAKRATVILIHGNDPEGREMGFLIPYFVVNGINVISYDQRGLGESIGNWFLSGPEQRAIDVDAVFDAFATDAHVDAKRIGLWGVSNGGWTAPIVATQRPVAFMLLKSAPAASVVENVRYGVTQGMKHDGYAAQVPQAMALWNAMLGALDGTTPWPTAKRAYDAATTQGWFDDAQMLRDVPMPPPPEMIAGFKRALSYDPTATLATVTTPTLALFGEKDQIVDVAHDAVKMRESFLRAGMKDYTAHILPNASHTLRETPTGFNKDGPKPARFVPGYPSLMVDWLRVRGFLGGSV